MKGIYCLIINVKKSIQIKVGSLGKIKFSRGKYLYVGSAQRGIKKRIERHFKKRKKKFWHIDYLLTNKNVEIEDVRYKKAKKDEECKVACFLNALEEPIKGFGSSDCSCNSHLFKLKKLNLNKLRMKGL